MSIADQFRVVGAGTGKPTFLEAGPPFTNSISGVVDIGWLWSAPDQHTLPFGIGTAPKRMALPGPGGTVLGVVRFPARSSSKLDVTDVPGDAAESGSLDLRAGFAS
jgi:hypothetical protein